MSLAYTGSLISDLWRGSEFGDPIQIARETARRANHKDRNHRAAESLQGWGVRREEEGRVLGAYDSREEPAWVRNIMDSKGMTLAEKGATFLAGLEGGAGSYNKSTKLMNDKLNAGKSFEQALAETAREQGISLKGFGSQQHMQRVYYMDQSHKAEVAQKLLKKQYDRYKEIRDKYHTMQEQTNQKHNSLSAVITNPFGTLKALVSDDHLYLQLADQAKDNEWFKNELITDYGADMGNKLYLETNRHNFKNRGMNDRLYAMGDKVINTAEGIAHYMGELGIGPSDSVSNFDGFKSFDSYMAGYADRFTSDIQQRFEHQTVEQNMAMAYSAGNTYLKGVSTADDLVGMYATMGTMLVPIGPAMAGLSRIGTSIGGRVLMNSPKLANLLTKTSALTSKVKEPISKAIQWGKTVPAPVRIPIISTIGGTVNMGVDKYMNKENAKPVESFSKGFAMTAAGMLPGLRREFGNFTPVVSGAFVGVGNAGWQATIEKKGFNNIDFTESLIAGGLTAVGGFANPLLQKLFTSSSIGFGQSFSQGGATLMADAIETTSTTLLEPPVRSAADNFEFSDLWYHWPFYW